LSLSLSREEEVESKHRVKISSGNSRNFLFHTPSLPKILLCDQAHQALLICDSSQFVAMRNSAERHSLPGVEKPKLMHMKKIDVAAIQAARHG